MEKLVNIVEKIDPFVYFDRLIVKKKIDEARFTKINREAFEGIPFVHNQLLAIKKIIGDDEIKKGKLGWQKKEKEIIEKYQNGSMSRRNFIRTFGILAILIGFAGTAGVSAYTYLTQGITFEEAKQNPKFRQAYLNKIFKNRKKYGVPEWNAFAGFFYDPDNKICNIRSGSDPFNLLDPEFRKKNDIILAYTPFYKEGSLTNRPGKKSYVHVLDGMFKVCVNEDDVLFNLDNEAFHAFVIRNKRLPIERPLRVLQKPSERTYDLINEILSAELQCYYMDEGRREPSALIRRITFFPAKEYYGALISIANNQTLDEISDDGVWARGVLKYIETRGTRKYFEEKPDYCM